MSDNKITGICCCVYSSSVNNKRLTVEASGKGAVVHGGVPIISSVATSHIVGIDKNSGVYRLNGKDEQIPLAKSAEKAREMLRIKGIEIKTNEAESLRD